MAMAPAARWSFRQTRERRQRLSDCDLKWAMKRALDQSFPDIVTRATMILRRRIFLLLFSVCYRNCEADCDNPTQAFTCGFRQATNLTGLRLTYAFLMRLVFYSISSLPIL
jgi:hypothetical protein